MPIRISSQFRPMTYDELSKPLIQATEAQMALEDQYSAMQTEAAKWQQLANEQTDHRAYTQLKAYSDDLSAQADALLKQGLSPSTRAAMLNMKRRYSKDVTPIEQAYNKREALVNEQRKASLANPSLLFERDASKISLDDFLLNPQLDYGKAYSGEEITKQVAQAVSSVAAGMKSIVMGQPLDKYTNTVIQKSGFTPEQIQYAIQNGQAGDILVQIRDRVLNSTGISTWGDQATQKRALDYANQGLYAGIGQQNISTISNEVQRRNDNLADRNVDMLIRGFRYNKDTGQYEYDQSLAAQIATGKKGAKATTTTVTPKSETFIGKDTITKKDIFKVVDQDGNEHICIKSGNSFYPVENPDDIVYATSNNTATLKTPQQQDWENQTGGAVAWRTDGSKQYSTEETKEAVNNALKESDTEYIDGASDWSRLNQSDKDQIKKIAKDANRPVSDFIIIKSYNRKNKIIMVSKSAASGYEGLLEKAGIASSKTESQKEQTQANTVITNTNNSITNEGL